MSTSIDRRLFSCCSTLFHLRISRFVLIFGGLVRRSPFAPGQSGCLSGDPFCPFSRRKTKRGIIYASRFLSNSRRTIGDPPMREKFLVFAASLALSAPLILIGCKSSTPAPAPAGAPAQSSNPDGSAAPAAPPPAGSPSSAAAPSATPAVAPAAPAPVAAAPPPPPQPG